MAGVMVNRLLLIAYHYPPVSGSSGVQRTLAFSRYLAENGWQPLVLTAHPRAYESAGNDQMADIPGGLVIHRAFALDSKRHLAVRGKYPAFLAIPDRWSTWWLGGVVSGLKLIRKHRPKVIWSTYPIVTAHLIGLTLHKLTGLPWVADFRDSMIDDSFPRDPLLRKVHLSIERRVVKAASRILFTTQGTVEMYRERYPLLPGDKWQYLANGYNEELFAEVEKSLDAGNRGERGASPITLLHSGVIYPSERDPQQLFEAVRELKDQGVLDHTKLTIVLRATGHDEYFRPMIEGLGIADIVALEPGLPYRDALREMLRMDGLLILQAANCNHQIPAKLYEYFRARRPILALTDPAGCTARELKKLGYTHIVALDDSKQISGLLMQFINSINSGLVPVAADDSISIYSRRAQTSKLADLFNELIAP
jgi:glycosyltransferase involved in cell wall biosynthesis